MSMELYEPWKPHDIVVYRPQSTMEAADHDLVVALAVNYTLMRIMRDVKEERNGK